MSLKKLLFTVLSLSSALQMDYWDWQRSQEKQTNKKIRINTLVLYENLVSHMNYFHMH